MAKFTLRLPDDLQEVIQTRADREERSLHAQIIYTLREAVQRAGAPARSTHDEARQAATAQKEATS